MRTAILLAFLLVLFATACYLTLVVWRLPQQVAFAVVLLATVAGVWGIWRVSRPDDDDDDDPEGKNWAPVVVESRRRLKESKRRRKEDKQRMLAAIAANPDWERFRADVERETIVFFTDLEYRSDPQARHTCEHLRPVEDLLRRKGCMVGVSHTFEGRVVPGVVWTPTVLDKLPALSECVRYEEESYLEERVGMRHEAKLTCVQCGSTIHAAHKEGRGPATRLLSEL